MWYVGLKINLSRQESPQYHFLQAHVLKLDPAKIAGPLETAFQDIVGQSFLLGVSYAVFSSTEQRM